MRVDSERGAVTASDQGIVGYIEPENLVCGHAAGPTDGDLSVHVAHGHEDCNHAVRDHVAHGCAGRDRTACSHEGREYAVRDDGGCDRAASDHADHELHHHHTHAFDSRHPGGHHLLQVESLTVAFTMYDSAAPFWRAGRVRSEVLHDLSLSVHVGEVLAVVGASGSGKTVLADSLMGQWPNNAEVNGRIWFDGVAQDGNSLAALRGHGMSMVPQGVTNLDPLMRVGDQVLGASRTPERRARTHQLFIDYGLGAEAERLYPHQLSGGMARRVLLMCALMDEPRLIIADEPTPGLDLDLAAHALDDLRAFANRGGGVLLITHDIELALRVADRVAIFHDGTVVEETGVENFASPDLLRHPFTKALWHALPGHDFSAAAYEGTGA